MAFVTYLGPFVDPFTTLKAFGELSPQLTTLLLFVVVLVEASAFSQSSKLFGTFPGAVLTTAASPWTVCAKTVVALKIKKKIKVHNFVAVGLPKIVSRFHR